MTGSCKNAKMVARREVYQESRSRLCSTTFAPGYAAMSFGGEVDAGVVRYGPMSVCERGSIKTCQSRNRVAILRALDVA